MGAAVLGSIALLSLGTALVDECTRPVAAAPADVDDSQPLTPALVPGERDILRNLGAWDRATPEERRARAVALEAHLPGFALRGLVAFACGEQRHEVAVYVDEPTGIEFVLVPAGVLEGCRTCPGGGAEKPRLAIASPFLAARTEVTVAQWRREMEDDAAPSDGADVAMGHVSFDGALRFCRRAGFDLPSREQWAYLARGGAATRYCFGDDGPLGEYAWSAANSGLALHAVGRKRPNAFGIFDVHGNAREWCRGVHGPYRYRLASGEGADRGSASSWYRSELSERWFTGLRPVFTIEPPPARAPMAGEVLHAWASGVQTYRCVAGADGALTWKFTGPAAELFDDDGRLLGTHSLGTDGPVWTIGTDTVGGRKLAERPSPNDGAIPELELACDPPADAGAFARVNRIERVRTLGGSPPAVGGHAEGDEIRVPYSAEYVFRVVPE